jgi:hypothetical protein
VITRLIILSIVYMKTTHNGFVHGTFDFLADNPVIRLISRVMNRLRLPKTLVDDAYKFFFRGTESGKLQKFLFLIGSVVILSKIVRGAISLYRTW